MSNEPLELENPPPGLIRTELLSASLNRISWILLAVSAVGLFLIAYCRPIQSIDPHAAFFRDANGLGPILNVLGGIFALASLLLKARRRSGAAMMLHFFAYFIWTPLSFA
jgi:hypothetical protein